MFVIVGFRLTYIVVIIGGKMYYVIFDFRFAITGNKLLCFTLTITAMNFTTFVLSMKYVSFT